MVDVKQEFGAFGKMPSLGDFFRVNVSAAFVQKWDEWLQNGILSARKDLGERWQDCYMSAPIWRFTLSAGLAGPSPVLGILMPSVDRVGRQFPLTLVRPLPMDGQPATEHFRSGKEFEALEAVALSALDDDMTRDKLETSLSEIINTAQDQVTELSGDTSHIALQNGLQTSPQASLAGILAADKFTNPSVWSAATPQGSRVLVCSGLPGGAQIPGLFCLDAGV